MVKYMYYFFGISLIIPGLILTIYNPIGGWELVFFILGLILFSKGSKNE
jgi:hypothetical protein